MACGFDHRVVAGTAIGVAIAYRESQTGRSTAWPLLGGGLGAACGTLPDVIEPALNPNHRQFFHSLAFAAALGYCAYKLYQWKPEEPWQQVARMVGLIAISAYLIHLAMDATTPKSLPVVGKIR
jgi:membrane-bound metal-dependent hydrolase YbcI (DUF457 family)